MKIIGLTGGIGSGKTTVSKIFETIGAPVFNADNEAKKLYKNQAIINTVKEILGDNDIIDEKGNLLRSKMADIIFNDEIKRNALNQLIHPLVKKQFEIWKLNNHFPYCIREAAILIESNSYKDCDKIIVVTCYEKDRINRVMLRDVSIKEDVEKRIMAQIKDEVRLKYAHFIIQNNNQQTDLLDQVLKIHNQLIA